MRINRQTNRPRCVAVRCRTLQDHCGSLRRIAVQAAHAAVECIAHETPLHINGGTLWKRYRKLTDHGNACGSLRCIPVHYSALRKRCGGLADHWNASKPLQFTMTQCRASSARCGGVHHTRKRQNSIHFPCHSANLQKPIANTTCRFCSSTPLFPTPPYSPKIFSMFPGSRWMIFGLQRVKMLG